MSDSAEGISSIEWTVYGKIQQITRSNGTRISYSYDAAGNRISKSVQGTDSTTQTWYVRDGSGNVLATVSDKKTGHDAGGGTIDYYEADIVSASDYAPFGMQLPGRTFNPPNGIGIYAKQWF